MGDYIEFQCDTCDSIFIQEDNVFWVDSENKLKISLLGFSTSEEMDGSKIAGHYREYYCYNCNSSVDIFVIRKKPKDMDNSIIFELIEKSNNNLKIIVLDDEFHECVNCGAELKSSPLFGSFAFENDNFYIDDVFVKYYGVGKNYDFWGFHYNFNYPVCKEKFNKFVIRQNNK